MKMHTQKPKPEPNPTGSRSPVRTIQNKVYSDMIYSEQWYWYLRPTCRVYDCCHTITYFTQRHKHLHCAMSPTTNAYSLAALVHT